MPMQEYRAFLVGPDGHVVSRIDLLCIDEQDARERARRLAEGHAVELWEGARRIERFEAER